MAENDKLPTESEAVGASVVESPGPVPQPMRDPITDRHTAKTTL